MDGIFKSIKEIDAYNSRTYKFGQGNDRVTPKAGNKRVVPFVNACMKDVQKELDKWLSSDNTEKKADRIYTNMSAYAKTPVTITWRKNLV